MSPRYEVVFNSQQHLHLPSRYNTFIIESESLALALLPASSFGSISISGQRPQRRHCSGSGRLTPGRHVGCKSRRLAMLVSKLIRDVLLLLLLAAPIVATIAVVLVVVVVVVVVLLLLLLLLLVVLLLVLGL